MTTTLPRMLWPVLFIADLFHPVHGLPIEPFLNGDVRHGRCRQRAMPMLFTWGEPDHVTGSNLLDRATPALGASAARGHDECLTERVRVPCRPSARLERDARD